MAAEIRYLGRQPAILESRLLAAELRYLGRQPAILDSRLLAAELGYLGRQPARIYHEHSDDQEKGFVGNTILLTQPRPEEIMQKLPPPDAEVSKYLSVCYNNQTMTAADVGSWA